VDSWPGVIATPLPFTPPQVSQIQAEPLKVTRWTTSTVSRPYVTRALPFEGNTISLAQVAESLLRPPEQFCTNAR